MNETRKYTFLAFDGRGFSTVEESAVGKWRNDGKEDSDSDFLTRAGFTEKEDWPSNGGTDREYFSFVTFENLSHPAWRYVTVVDNVVSGRFILTANEGDLTSLILQYLMPARMAEATEKMYDLIDVMEKSFRAVHGHDVLNSCSRCDPEGVRRMEIASAKARGT